MYIVYIIFGLTLINLMCSVYLLILVLSPNAKIADVHEPDVEEVEETTDAQIARKEFSDRIARIKDELAREHAKPQVGHSAQILHPGITNLPHNNILDSERIPDIEYAD